MSRETLQPTREQQVNPTRKQHVRGLNHFEVLFENRSTDAGHIVLTRPELDQFRHFLKNDSNPENHKPSHDAVREPEKVDQGPVLTDREGSILQLSAAGLSSSEIGKRLHLAEKTIKHAKVALFKKLEVSSGITAVLKGVELGIVDPKKVTEGTDSTRFKKLTSRQRYLMHYMTEHPEKTNAQIAEELSLSERMVKDDVLRTYKTLGVKNRNQAHLLLMQLDEERTSMENKSVIEEEPNILTENEMKVIRLKVQGLTTTEIGERLSFARKTIKNAVTRIYKKLDVGSEMEAAVKSVELGIVDPAAAQDIQLDKYQKLSPRQKEIVEYLAEHPEASANADIAAALQIAPKTVESHIAWLYEKLEVTGRVQAVMGYLAYERQDKKEEQEPEGPPIGEQILFMRARGLPAREIGKQLEMSETKVNKKSKELYKELQVDSPMQAVEKGIEVGLLDPDEVTQGMNREGLETLTPRERQLILEEQEKTNAELLEEFDVNEKHLQRLRAGIRSKLGARNMQQARAFYVASKVS